MNINELNSKLKRIIRFSITGFTCAIINLGFLYLLVNKIGFNTNLLENIANIISMEISIIVNFFINREWTWNDTKKKFGNDLFKQMLFFHIIVGLSIILRIILFPILQYFGLIYIVNSGIGIALGAMINFIFYDKLIFKKNNFGGQNETIGV